VLNLYLHVILIVPFFSMDVTSIFISIIEYCDLFSQSNDIQRRAVEYHLLRVNKHDIQYIMKYMFYLYRAKVSLSLARRNLQNVCHSCKIHFFCFLCLLAFVTNL